MRVPSRIRRRQRSRRRHALRGHTRYHHHRRRHVLQCPRWVAPCPPALLQGTHRDPPPRSAARKAALASASEENRRIVEVVQRYAIRHASRGVSFTCKQAASVSPDVHIAAGTPTLDCIAAVFGHGIRRELLPIEVSRQPPAPQQQPQGAVAEGSCEPAGGDADDDDGTALRFRASGFVSSANYSMKRGVCIFFINDRLVDCAPLRKAMEVRRRVSAPSRRAPSGISAPLAVYVAGRLR